MEPIVFILIFVILYLIFSYEKPKPKEYECRIEYFENNLSEYENKNKLSELQKEGWEISGEITTKLGPTGMVVYIPFKRLKKNP